MSKKKKLLTLFLALTVVFTMSFAAVPAYGATPTGTAISTVEDLKAMESNPSGSYYLANDIDLSGETNLLLFADSQNPFKGTLDGNGKSIKGYQYTASSWKEDVALFGNAEGATFKNLTMSNVNIEMTGGGSAAGLLAMSRNCTFNGVKTTGTIKISNHYILDEDDCPIDDGCKAAGIVYYESEKGTFASCTNDIDITLTHKGQNAPVAAGVVWIAGKGSIKNCTNKGNLSLTHTPDPNWGSSECEAVGITGLYTGSTNISGCKNSGNITITGKKTTDNAYNFTSSAAGIIISTNSSVISCSNTGNISIINNARNHQGSTAAGVACNVSYVGKKVSKCSNSGAISYKGAEVGIGKICIAGVVGSVSKAEQTYNKGKISVNSNVTADAGGIAGFCADMRNCYNAGTVTHKGKGNAGGLAATADVLDGYVKLNYSTGKVSGSNSKLIKGQLIGYYGGGYDVMKRNIFNNYYTTSGKAYGAANFTWKPWLATAIKVSKITSAGCSKLSSKYWTYSSKYGRLILKNNKEK